LDEFARQHERQVRLLCSAMLSLREGGRLVYSTCSLEGEENEAVVAESLDRQRGFRLLPWSPQVRALEAEGILYSGTAERLFASGLPDDFVRLLPGAYQGDGFFAACLTRD
jgi:16S rRNA (cytosine967-C5)-methyltransferase